MKKLLLLYLVFVLVSCSENEIEQFEPVQQDTPVDCSDIVTDASGRKYPDLEPPSYQYCGQGWGRKMCRFLRKHDGTIWADAENYYSDFSDIKFSNFDNDIYFISFFNLDSITSYCKGWKRDINTYDGIKWNIEIKRDEQDVFGFDYDYYGYSQEIEYSISYKYEVIDGLLHVSSSEDESQTYIFHPSAKSYSEDVLATDEIIRLEGCIF